MGIKKLFQRISPASSTQDARSSPASSLFWPILVSNLVLSASSIASLGLIGSAVAFSMDQEHNVHRYLISSPGLLFFLNVEPAHLRVDPGHTSIGAAGYGFFVGLLGLFVAWRIQRDAQISRFLLALLVLQLLAAIFILSTLIFVFVVTYQTTGQSIRIPVAANTQGQNYGEYRWTPETWFQAVRDLPLADKHVRDEMDAKVTNMVAWRWMLIAVFVADVLAFGVTTFAWLKQRKGTSTRENSANTTEK